MKDKKKMSIITSTVNEQLVCIEKLDTFHVPSIFGDEDRMIMHLVIEQNVLNFPSGKIYQCKDMVYKL